MSSIIPQTCIIRQLQTMAVQQNLRNEITFLRDKTARFFSQNSIFPSKIDATQMKIKSRKTDPELKIEQSFMMISAEDPSPP